jgi:hypothetical protein
VVTRARRRRWPARVAGLLGTAALLGTGAAIATMVVPSEDEQAVPTAPAATPERERRAPKPLTRAQRRERRAAVAMLTKQGFEPVKPADYDPRNRLRVLVGDDGNSLRAFFFAGRRFLGHDAETPSGQLRVVRAGDRSATLAYGLYESGDRPCCPQGGTARVRFRLGDGRVAPRGEVPPPAARLPAA